ncbi:MAG: hypothetical protein KA155_07090 [Alphaproteobacteria bacterium]|jgi:20S proteasome alpha/beta subunit|nr:hypothetical protein [Alphaproteobacteria bacterium]
MTVVVAIKCSDGDVIACDSMLTVGNFAQNGQKIHILPGPPAQIFAFAGHLDLADRFRAEAEHHSPHFDANSKLAYVIAISRAMVENLQATAREPLKADLITVLSFVKNDVPETCIFMHGSQPRFLDRHHFYQAIGSGSTAAMPFLKFLIDIFLPTRQPTVAEGKQLAVWAVKYAIETMSGGVGGTIDLATIQRNEGVWELRELSRAETQEAEEAMSGMKLALLAWKEEGQADGVVIPEPPEEHT